jgi:hypothetical protein
MAAPTDGSSSSGAATAATAAKLRDEALAAAKLLEDEAEALRSTNVERSQQLQDDAALLKSAADAQERVRAAADALEQERAQAHTLEQRTAALRSRHRTVSNRDDDAPGDEFVDDDTHSLTSDAAAVARLHSQAAAVQNIRNLIPVTLDLQESNFSKWRGYVLLILGRFALQDHVLGDAPRLPDPAWCRMDCVVLSWLFNTISTDLLDVIHDRNGVTARVAWLGLEEQFLNNRASRAMLIDAEFRALTQGTLSIDAYCRKMKSLADALADLGEPVPDSTLVLNILRGLGERFHVIAQLIPRQRPLPSFNDVRADLRLAELTMTASSASPPTALVASSPGKPPALAPPPGPPRQPPVAGGSQGNGRGRRRRGGRGHGGFSAGPPGGHHWPSVYNPWTGSIQMWPGPTTGGHHGTPPRPGPAAPSPRALMAAGAPLPLYAPPAPGPFHQGSFPPSSWDSSTLANAFSTVP